MSAETDIAAIDDGGANTAAEVRTALTAVLARADADPPTAKVTRQSTSQTIANATFTPIQWDTEVWDTDGIVDLGTSTTNLTIRTAGKYQISAGFLISDAANGLKVQMNIKQGSTIMGSWTEVAGATTTGVGVLGSVAINASVNDVVTIDVFHEAGAGVTIGGNVRTFCSLLRFAS